MVASDGLAEDRRRLGVTYKERETRRYVADDQDDERDRANAKEERVLEAAAVESLGLVDVNEAAQLEHAADAEDGHDGATGWLSVESEAARVGCDYLDAEATAEEVVAHAQAGTLDAPRADDAVCDH